jgi:hypothetical protein
LIEQNIFIPVPTKTFNAGSISRGTWLAILHSQRIPPHVGLLFNGNYSSLTIKEAELNISNTLLLETISRKKIKSVFIKIVSHPVFSVEHQRDMFQEELKKNGCVEQYKATCLTPVKHFFQEFYAIPSNPDHLLFEFIQQLDTNHYIDFAMAVNTDLHEGIELPFYTQLELNEKIKNERQNYFNY